MKKIVVPDGMLKASEAKRVERYGPMSGWAYAYAPMILEAALLWLSENPIVPTDEQARELWEHPKVLNDHEHYAKAMARDWQRLMFLAPEPEEIKDLMKPCIPSGKVELGSEWNDAILEAYRRGKESK